MNNLATLIKKQFPVLLIIFAAGILLVGYYLIYIPSRTVSLENQHFRWLQNIDKNIREKIDGYDTLLDNLSTAYSLTTDKAKASGYISNYQVLDGTVKLITAVKDSPGNPKKNESIFGSDKKFDLYTDSSINDLNIYLHWQTETQKSNYLVITTKFESFIKPLLPKDIFDHYVLFYEGNRIYEDFHSGISYRTEDSLLMQNRKTFLAPTIFNQNIGGENYKIFLQPVNFGNKRIIIAGLHSVKSFDKEKKNLPAGIVIFCITLSLTLLLLIPWIKIYSMGKNDRLYLKDAMWAIIVAKLLTSVMFYIIFKNNDTSEQADFKKSSRQLASHIAYNLSEETKDALSALDSLDSIHNNLGKQNNNDYSGIGGDWNKFKKCNSQFPFEEYSKNPGDTVIWNRSVNAIKKISFNQINWLDSTGKVIYNWTSRTINSIHAYYPYRDYFKNVFTDKMNVVRNSPTGNLEKFSIDQVMSRTNGSFSTLISKRSADKSSMVVALNFNMKCVDNVVLPVGYSFAVITDSGLVRYDSNKDKNLNENLIEEFSTEGKAMLTGVIRGGYDKFFSTDYYEKNYNVYVRPVSNLPYYIVILKNTKYQESAETSTFFFTAGMTLLFFFIVVIDLFVLFYSSSRVTRLEKHNLVTGWLWPRKSSEGEYKFAVIGNVLILAILILIYAIKFFNFLEFLFSLVVSISLITCFLNILFFIRYKTIRDEIYIRHKAKAAIWNGVLLILYNIISAITLGFESYLKLLGYESIIIILLSLLALSRLKQFSQPARKEALKKSMLREKDENTDGFDNNDRYVHWYAAMAVSRLLITSALPIIFLYVSSFNFEESLMTRYWQYNFAKQIKAKFGMTTPETIKRLNNPKLYTNAVYIDSGSVNSLKEIQPEEWKKLINDTAGQRQSSLATILFTSFGRYIDGQFSINNNFLYNSFSFDKSLVFNNLYENVLKKGQQNEMVLCADTIGPAKSTFIKIVEGPKRNYQFAELSNFRGLFFWSTIVGAICILYFLLILVIKKVCARDLPHIIPFKNPGKELELKRDGPSKFFLVTTELEDTVHMLGTLFKTEKSKIIDFQEPNLFSSKYVLSLFVEDANHIIIVYHLEDDLNDVALNTEKLSFLTLASGSSKKVIIVSKLFPIDIQLIMNNDEENITNLLKAFAYSSIRTALFKGYIIHTLPFKEFKTNNTGKLEPDKNTWLLRCRILEETKFSSFLWGAGQLLIDELSAGPSNPPNPASRKITPDFIILEILSFAGSFYQSIWNCLNEDEKFVLYDLAEDGLVNTKDVQSFIRLIRRGLVVIRDGGLHIFNNSFRIFIITSLQSDEYHRINKRYKEGSSWNKIQTPLVLGTLAILMFLSVSQDAIYSKVAGILTAFTAVIPLVLSLFRLQAPAGKKEPGN